MSRMLTVMQRGRVLQGTAIMTIQLNEKSVGRLFVPKGLFKAHTVVSIFNWKASRRVVKSIMISIIDKYSK